MKRSSLFALVPALLLTGVAGAQQFPILDMIADRVVQQYQQSTCEQLWVKKGEGPSAREQEAVQQLRNNPQMRVEFLNRIAGPVVNKMFECGMIP